MLLSTNHLDDRALYRHLWAHTLNKPAHELDDSMGDCTEHIDLIGDGSEESERIYLQYYADDFERKDWRDDHPGEPLPAKLDPPSKLIPNSTPSATTPSRTRQRISTDRHAAFGRAGFIPAFGRSLQ